jgi:hypothetical protein
MTCVGVPPYEAVFAGQDLPEEEAFSLGVFWPSRLKAGLQQAGLQRPHPSPRPLVSNHGMAKGEPIR